ncbi:hypothetical protein [Bradyrhizobium neotropicale]|uniref:hypothetical protein n=1 Tax=Bradyrhizobium neotropicale TaxID=1497615 RepID=UPI001AD77D57|nr:hypothetical protein [Bradyrhizobium neotropicale]MBO4222437.1 hypothetical protein [Bradyrhizobium neotropicale]
MTKSVLVSLAILTLATSTALAAQRTHHRHPMNAYAGMRAAPVVAPGPAIAPGGVSSGDRDMYFRNLHDSGYNPKNNFNSVGNVVTQ